MRIIALAALLLTGCAWTPRQSVYPSGLVLIRLDQRPLDPNHIVKVAGVWIDPKDPGQTFMSVVKGFQ